MNREFPPFVDPGSRAPELLHVNASTRHGRSLSGVTASDRYHSSLSDSTFRGHATPATASVQIAQAAPAAGASPGSETGEKKPEPPAAPPSSDSSEKPRSESEESTGSILEGAISVESEADADSGAPSVSTKISQGRASPPSTEVSRAVAFIIAKYLNQSRFADCLLALDNLTVLGSMSESAETAILGGCTEIINAIAEESKDPNALFGYGVLSSTEKESTTKSGANGTTKKTE